MDIDNSKIDFNTFCVGKRGKNKWRVDYGMKDYYKYYAKTVTFSSVSKSKYFKGTNPPIVDERLYRQIVKDYFSIIARDVIFKSKVVRIPLFGHLSVRKRKMNFSFLSEKQGGLKIDFKKSKEAGKIVHHLNEHRNNYSYGFKWERILSSHFQKFYYLSITRTNKRLLAQTLLNNKNIDYFEVKEIKKPKYRG